MPEWFRSLFVVVESTVNGMCSFLLFRGGCDRCLVVVVAAVGTIVSWLGRFLPDTFWTFFIVIQTTKDGQIALFSSLVVVIVIVIEDGIIIVMDVIIMQLWPRLLAIVFPGTR